MDYRCVKTTCPYCGCGCQMLLEVLDGRLTDTLPSKEKNMNQGKLCIKGQTAHEFVHSPDRLTHPLVRKNGKLEPATWDEAFEAVTSNFSRIKDTYGGDSVGFFSSARSTNEENYLCQKLCRTVFQTNNIDHCARLWHAPTVAGLAASFGSGAMTNSIAEIEDADCLLVVGSNTTEAHPLIAYRMFRAKEKGAKLIVVDPRKIQLAAFADIHIQLNYGTDIAFFNGVMNEILNTGLHNQDFIAAHTEDFEALKATVTPYTLERVSGITGVSIENIRETARLYASSKNSSICYTLGITEHSFGVDNVKTLANLTMLTGQIGKASSGVNPLRGQNNVQGACDMGALPNVYPGYQPVTDLHVQKKFQDAWGVELSPRLGKTIPEMMDGLIEGSMKGLYIFGENSVEGDPNTGHVRHALESAEFLVVQDIFLTATAQMAHVVLPGACWAEVDGTFSNTERRVQRVRKAVDPPEQALANWKIFSELGTRFGVKMEYSSSEDIFREMAALTPSFSGISYGRIDFEGLQWPCPSPEHPGTRFLHQGGMFTRGKGKFHAIEHQASKDEPDSEYPFTLTTGRRYAHYNTSTMTGRCKTLLNEFPEPVAQVNDADALALGLKNGDAIRVISRWGEVVTPVRIGDIVPAGSLFMDFHFPDANSNQVLGTFLDPVSKTPDYKVCAVKLEKCAP